MHENGDDVFFFYLSLQSHSTFLLLLLQTQVGTIPGVYIYISSFGFFRILLVSWEVASSDQMEHLILLFLFFSSRIYCVPNSAANWFDRQEGGIVNRE